MGYRLRENVLFVGRMPADVDLSLHAEGDCNSRQRRKEDECDARGDTYTTSTLGGGVLISGCDRVMVRVKKSQILWT